jgi:hypothetical protein
MSNGFSVNSKYHINQLCDNDFWRSAAAARSDDHDDFKDADEASELIGTEAMPSCNDTYVNSNPDSDEAFFNAMFGQEEAAEFGMPYDVNNTSSDTGHAKNHGTVVITLHGNGSRHSCKGCALDQTKNDAQWLVLSSTVLPYFKSQSERAYNYIQTRRENRKASIAAKALRRWNKYFRKGAEPTQDDIHSMITYENDSKLRMPVTDMDLKGLD